MFLPIEQLGLLSIFLELVIFTKFEISQMIFKPYLICFQYFFENLKSLENSYRLEIQFL
jgi:hypothetical protein